MTRPGRRWWDFWLLQAVICYVAYEVFEWARGQVQGSRAASIVHARNIISTERFLHIFHEARAEHWILPCAPICNVATVSALQSNTIKFLNIYYGLMHFVVPPLVLIYLYFWHFQRYRLWRNTAGLMLAISMLGFWLYPVLPPRLLAAHFGFFDASHFGGVGPIGQAEAGPMANAYAAMPSLHIAWSTFCVCAAVPVVRNRLMKVLLILHPVVTFLAVIVTANHYILDCVGGLVNLGLAYLVARAVTSVRAGEGAAPETPSTAGGTPTADRTTTAPPAP
ncbi:MAG: phosphatase PAP2 family protein [Acidimicrobiia bacterium]|nr:phosphatase PAP2 family protein [Acidimicrobiia bacterium]